MDLKKRLLAASLAPSGSKWPTAALLCFVNLINYMDRYTISGRKE